MERKPRKPREQAMGVNAENSGFCVEDIEDIDNDGRPIKPKDVFDDFDFDLNTLDECSTRIAKTGATGTANETIAYESTTNESTVNQPGTSTVNQPGTSKTTPSHTYTIQPGHTSQTSKNQNNPREWTLESIRALKRYMDIEFQQLRLLEEIEQIDESVKYGLLISSVRPGMEQDYFSSAINNILVKRTYMTTICGLRI